MKATKVKFLIEPEYNRVFAYFAEDNYYGQGNIGYGGVTASNWKDTKTCYASIGQHSSCHKDYAAKCKEANYNEYKDLLKELISIGYKKLQVLNSEEIECTRNPTKGEIKAGYGATHYRTFNLASLIKRNGDLKKHFNGEDGLRYNRY